MTSRDISIQHIFATAILSVVGLITLFMTIVVTIYFLTQVQSNLEDSTRQTVYQLRKNVNSYITGIIKIGSAVPNIIDNTSNKEQIHQSLKVIEDSRSDIVAIDIFDLEGNILYGTSSFNLRSPKEIIDQNWFKYSQTHTNSYYFSSPHVQQLVPLKYPWVISFSEVIKLSDSNGNRQSAILLIDINQDSIDSIIESVPIGKNGYCFIVDKNYNIVFHPKQTLINLGQFVEDIESLKVHILGKYYFNYQGVKRFNFIDTIDFTGWKIIGISYPNEERLPLVLSFLSLVSLLILVIIVAGFLLSRIVSNYVTSPIRQLEREMENFSITSFRSLDLKQPSMEVRSLANSFTKMALRMQTLMDDIVEEQKLIRKSELEALQAKINPHFLYNTLDTIVWFAESHDYKNVIEMVKALAQLFRISISKDHEVITLEEEMTHVECYLTIQEKRFVDKLTFKILLPEELKHKPVIKLLIQPIVENAIYHGIRYLMDPGHIRIEVLEDKEDIIIRVIDNGVGIDKETQATLLTTDKKEHERHGNGIGVFNVNKRIKLAYGDFYGITIQSEIDEGSTFELRIPKQKDIKAVNKLVKI
ncbi:cache domain-containing sensor histidine kinase [Spirochaeta cellobiosiphila]|uniref:cache domain-containing sensor histidine kinase n=1 Tax=Spirochaeta cellobiosiphila TaxID=504483 RepID=UPI00048B9560|nr:sensor histidine kinase [Spirochaeta cellobiosiphila]